MRILLVNPCWPDSRPALPGEASAPPLGLAYIAAAVGRAGFEVQIQDMAVAAMRPPDIAPFAVDFDVVGISANMTCTAYSCLDIARRVKGANPRAFVVLGGNHATFEYRHLLQEPAVDAVCTGEGEVTFLEVAEHVARGRPFKGCAGAVWRDGQGRVVIGPPRPRVDDLDVLPMPARYLLPLKAYDRAGNVSSSRGCPFGCTFCSTSAFNGRTVRRHSIGRVLNEVSSLVHDYGCRDIEFSDDTFTLDRRRVLDFCAGLQVSGLDIRWSCSTRVDVIDPDLLRTMRDAGCWRMFLGVESARQEVLDGVAKGIDAERVLDAFEWCRRLGIKTVGAFIVGLPGDTLEGLRATANFIRRAQPDMVAVSILKPFPGTPVRERADELGIRITCRDYARYRYVSPACATATMSPDDVRRGYVMLQLATRDLARQMEGSASPSRTAGVV